MTGEKKPVIKDLLAWFHLNELSKIGKSIEIESKLVLTYCYGGLGRLGVIAKENRVSLGDHEKFLKLIIVIDAQLVNLLEDTKWITSQ